MVDWEGRVLCRGGEELELEKTIDRFTVALPSLNLLPQLGAKLEAEVLCHLAALGLVEFRVGPDRLDQTIQLARQLPEVQFASHVYEMNGSTGAPIYLTNQVTVQFAEATDVEAMRTITSASGLQVVKLIPGVAKAFVFEVTQRATANPLKLAYWLMRQPQVLMAEPNVAVPVRDYFSTPNGETQELISSEPLLSQQEDIKATGILTQGDRSIVIALAAAEIDWHDAGFQGMGKIVAPLKISPPTPNLREDRDQSSSELGNLEGKESIQTPKSKLQNLLALAPECALMPIEMGRWLDDQMIEQVCQWAIEQGASVLTCEWAATAAYFPLSLRQRVALSRTAMQGREGRGCVVVFAAGGADRLALEPTEPGQENIQDAKHQLNGFAVHPDVIVVGAGTDHATGSTGTGSIAVWAEGEDSGAASAIVAATAALMLSVNSDLTTREMKQILQDTADRLPSPASQLTAQEGGYDGLGYSQQFGYGKVNALRAVQSAWQRVQPVESPDRWIERQTVSVLDIPDGDLRGGCSAIDIADAGLVKTIEISLEIAHSFMGDLEIVLISPGGKAILLQNRTLARTIALRKAYSVETTPALKALLNQPVAGQWQLKLIDHVVLNTGQLKQWQLRVGVRDEE